MKKLNIEKFKKMLHAKTMYCEDEAKAALGAFAIAEYLFEGGYVHSTDILRVHLSSIANTDYKIDLIALILIELRVLERFYVFNCYASGQTYEVTAEQYEESLIEGNLIHPETGIEVHDFVNRITDHYRPHPLIEKIYS